MAAPTLEERVAKLEKLAHNLLLRSETQRILLLVALADAVKNDAAQQARYDLIRAEARRSLAGDKRTTDPSLETAVFLHDEVPEALAQLLADWDYVQSNIRGR